MSWNYRIGTYMFSYKETFKDNSPKLAEMEDQRLFSIIEVYYDKDGTPNGYTEGKPTKDWEELSDLIGTLDLLKLAVDKPIIDMDSFPKEWHPDLEGGESMEYDSSTAIKLSGKKNLFMYHFLNVITFLGIFAFMVPPVLYYVITGNGYAHIFDLIRAKYNPNSKRQISNFFKPL